MTLPDSNAAQFLKQQLKAGDTQPFPSGQITYLAPLPPINGVSDQWGQDQWGQCH